jgi:hypothetical protein
MITQLKIDFTAHLFEKVDPEPSYFPPVGSRSQESKVGNKILFPPGTPFPRWFFPGFFPRCSGSFEA